MNATEIVGRPESYLIAMDETIFKKKIELASRMMEKGVQSDKELADSFDSHMDEGGKLSNDEVLRAIDRFAGTEFKASAFGSFATMSEPIGESEPMPPIHLSEEAREVNASAEVYNSSMTDEGEVPNDSKVIITPSFRPTTPRMKLICSHDARCARPTVLAIREWLSTQGFREGDIRSEARMSDDDMMMTPMMRGCDRGELSKQ